MPQPTQHVEAGTGLIPSPRTAPDENPGALAAQAAGSAGWGAAVARGLGVIRGLRSLRPVEARRQEAYGEVDGQ
ncbi:hypothetical protein [Streptomyces sp. TLI_171]|uniref:hypothetical protein n=1 Tax=Streptomyces sp. TLI_171 TaxID=1938859 RepID=UPI000C17D704|nr:hypothetical protein [Streptomyces sp. TLI_171]RKE20534.1 hypothetical protein BX266_3897 [Streptomyces sp. TLI_171]